MKKAFALLLALCLVMGLAACGGSENTDNTTTSSSATTTTESTTGTTASVDAPPTTESTTTTTTAATSASTTTTKKTTEKVTTTKPSTTTKATTTTKTTTTTTKAAPTTTKPNYPSVKLTADNWQEYFYLTTTLVPETYNPMGISNFLGFTEFCVRDEYVDRLYDFTFSATFKEMKRQVKTLTYDSNTGKTSISAYDETKWESLDTGVPFEEDVVDREAYAVALGMAEYAADDPMYIVEDRVSLYPMYTQRDGANYILAGSVNTEYQFSNIAGSITLKP